MRCAKTFVLVLALVLEGGCGDTKPPQHTIRIPEWATVDPGPCSERRLELLHRIPGLWDDEWPMIAWLYSTLRDATKGIAVGKPDLRPLSDAEGRRTLAEADVVLLGTRHQSSELARVRHRLILQLLRDGSTRPTDLAIVLECIPVGATAALRDALVQLKRDDGAAVRALLRRVWPWPVEPYVALLRELVPLGVRVLPAGVDLSRWTPSRKIADRQRSPQGEGNASWKEQFNAVSGTAAAAARKWVAAAPHRKAVVDCGLLHYFAGKAPIADELGAAGLCVLVEVGFIKEMEVALLSRFGANTCQSWFDLGSGLIRCPYPRIEEIVREDW